MLKVVECALKEEGYLEKASNAMLDSKTANAGYNNYTKYARDLDKIDYFNFHKQGYEWCAIFYNAMMVKAYGADNARKMMGQPKLQNCGAGCTEGANYYKRMGRFYTEPKIGDQIFFTNDGGKTSCHTGMVIDVKNGRVYTIEGNTRKSAGVVPNGGGVFKKDYPLNFNQILGYGRPKWELVGEDEVVEQRVVKIDGKDVKCNIIFKDGTNYIKIRDIAKLVGYDISNIGSIPVLTKKK